MPQSTLDSAQDRIKRFLAACDRKCWTIAQLNTALDEMREEWNLAERVTATGLADYLTDRGVFTHIDLDFRNRPHRRYWYGNPNPYELSQTVDQNAYLSHHTAAYLHGLISAEPDIVYLNSEQPSRGARGAVPNQEAIDRAFQRPPRESTNSARYERYTILRINGKNTGNLGVVSRRHHSYGEVRLTNIPRTLVDIAVRPEYSGGATTVLQAYTAAAGQFRVAELQRILDELDHIYPYHQAIGFYMDHSGQYSSDELAMLAKIPIERRFYLARQMEEPALSAEWQIFYPRDLGDPSDPNVSQNN